MLDVLHIVRPREEPRRLAALRELAATFSEQAISMGASVWDLLADFEGPKLSDADLLRRARQFQEAWLRRSSDEKRPRASDWQRFKAADAFGA